MLKYTLTSLAILLCVVSIGVAKEQSAPKNTIESQQTRLAQTQ